MHGQRAVKIGEHQPAIANERVDNVLEHAIGHHVRQVEHRPAEASARHAVDNSGVGPVELRARMHSGADEVAPLAVGHRDVASPRPDPLELV